MPTSERSKESRKERMLRLFKHAAKQQNKDGQFQVWTHENHALEVTGNSFIESKVEYIHNNPVRAGIVNRAEDYRYSSASSYAGEDSLLDVITVFFRVKTVK